MAKSSVVKYGSLAFLTIQNSLLILTLRYSRRLPGPKYLTSTAVLLSELLKLFLSFICYVFVWYRASKLDAGEIRFEGVRPLLLGRHRLGIKSRPRYGWLKDALPLLVPAVLYTIQNNLQFIAVSHLEAATFQVLYQGKILTTAICMVIFLGKRLSVQQCAAIVLLSIGISCASMPPSSSKRSLQAIDSDKQDHAFGVAAVGAACLLSGMAGVYTEMVLKKTQRQNDHPVKAFWLRSMQLSMMSVVFAVPSVLILDRRALLEHGFFQEYNGVVGAGILLQAIGGLAVAMVVTYADNILKGFATSISVIVSASVSTVLHRPTTPLFTLGMGCVIWASWLYTTKEEKRISTGSFDFKEKQSPALLPC